MGTCKGEVSSAATRDIKAAIQGRMAFVHVKRNTERRFINSVKVCGKEGN